MATEKTKTPGIYKVTGKKGRVKYRLFVNVQVLDALSASGWRWKLKGKTYASYQDALDAKVKVQGEVKSGKYVEATDATVKELVEKWLEAGRGKWKLQTYLSHLSRLERYIAPKLGDLKASKLRKAAVEQAASDWARSGLSARTVNKILNNVMSPAFKWALKDPDSFGINVNPLETVERLSTLATPEEIEARALGEIPNHGEDQPEGKPGTLREIQPNEVYSTLELKKIIEASQPGLERTLIMTAVFCGLRHGELCALRWSILNLKRGILTVNRSLTQLSKKRGGPRLERPKTKNAYRPLELPAPLLAELRRWKLQCPPNPNELVFVDALGKPVTRKNNNRMLKACAERAGVRPLSMNNLRHSFASQQLINGTTPLEVSYLMGHSSPAVTLSIYSHWAKTEKSQAQIETRQSNHGSGRRRGEG